MQTAEVQALMVFHGAEVRSLRHVLSWRAGKDNLTFPKEQTMFVAFAHRIVYPIGHHSKGRARKHLHPIADTITCYKYYISANYGHYPPLEGKN